MRFGHIALRVKNIDQMIDFYCNKFGLQEAFRINNDDGSLRIVYLHISNNQYLELCLGGDSRPDFDDTTDIGFRHVCFTVGNIFDIKSTIESKGVVFDSEILKLRDNNLTAYLYDPEGNKIEIVEINSDSPHKKFELDHSL